MFDVYHGTSPVYLTDLCSRAATITVSDRQHVMTSLYGVQGHVLLTAHSLLQDLPRGTHFLFTSGPLIHMIRFVAGLKLTYFLYPVDLCYIVYVAYIVYTLLFVRRC